MVKGGDNCLFVTSEGNIFVSKCGEAFFFFSYVFVQPLDKDTRPTESWFGCDRTTTSSTSTTTITATTTSTSTTTATTIPSTTPSTTTTISMTPQTRVENNSGLLASVLCSDVPQPDAVTVMGDGYTYAFSGRIFSSLLSYAVNNCSFAKDENKFKYLQAACVETRKMDVLKGLLYISNR